MAQCAACGTTILFGGETEGDLRFCGEKCHQQGSGIVGLIDSVPDDLVAQEAKRIHEGPCPRCGGGGPIDIHTSHHVWSALLMTSWGSNPQICCQSCGTKSRLYRTFSSALFGWWGFPWGLLVTPVQIVRNIGGLASAPDPSEPSEELVRMTRMLIAQQALEDSGEDVRSIVRAPPSRSRPPL